ncbi:MAG: Gfo/Idh/MocA family oxidoreductase [Bryobacteraceae bacterium]
MAKKVRWGVLGAARIAREKVIPAMQRGTCSEIAALASRDAAKARDAASALGIPRSYGSYEELLADPEIDAIYNPLPNDLHVPWTIKAMEAGKHVLCEKPLALDARSILSLIAARDQSRVKLGEAFMARTHPQWLRAKAVADSGEIGGPNLITGFFSYYNRDPKNIRNQVDAGGGALMDIGCYPITLSRMIFGAEPVRVTAAVGRDPELKIDRLTSAILEFPGGRQSVFTCGTQMAAYQRMQIFGDKGRIEIEIPFNAPPDQPTRIFVDGVRGISGDGPRVEEFPVVDQYTIQGDLFSRAILDDGPVPVSAEDALGNMAVIEAVFRAGASGQWEEVTLPNWIGLRDLPAREFPAP